MIFIDEKARLRPVKRDFGEAKEGLKNDKRI